VETPEATPPRASCFALGCVSPLIAAFVGILVWRIVDNATPCHCEGEPDDAWVESSGAMPWGFAASVLTFALLVYSFRRQSRKQLRSNS
jgi:hypothetical protein